ncbi:MAG: gluconate 2-dehydrogenase subunit 3 family protein [Chitinophagaceae bacterium]|nr:gluconate 2-dehydrogenase subunit 3 family protein [Chitinophagaceae bacterium]
MKRRTAIKNMMIFAGGIYLLPSCSGDPAKASIELTNIDVSSGQESLLAEIAETIIPRTNGAPGAKEMNLHLFTMKMVDDCHSGDEQQKFVAALRVMEKEKLFIGLESAQRKEFIEELLEDKKAPEELRIMMKITKQRVIQGFTNSKFAMTDLKQYELVPGRYNGYFPVENV